MILLIGALVCFAVVVLVSGINAYVIHPKRPVFATLALMTGLTVIGCLGAAGVVAFA